MLWKGECDRIGTPKHLTHGHSHPLQGMVCYEGRDACPNRPSRGLHPRSPLRRYPSPFRAACPDRATPCCGPLRRGGRRRERRKNAFKFPILPRRSLLRCWKNAVVLEDVVDGLVTGCIAQVREGVDGAVI